MSVGKISRNMHCSNFRKGKQSMKRTNKADRKAAALSHKIKQQEMKNKSRKKEFQVSPIPPSSVEELQLQVAVLLPLLQAMH